MACPMYRTFHALGSAIVEEHAVCISKQAAFAGLESNPSLNATMH